VPLYKYVTAVYALRFFQTGMVRFTQPAEFNDPFELRPHIRGLADADTIAQQADLVFQQSSIRTEVGHALEKLRLSPNQRRMVDVDELVKRIGGQRDQGFEFIKGISDAVAKPITALMNLQFNDTLGIFCLTEEPIESAHVGALRRSSQRCSYRIR
jgi:hypothetical protein